jgi:hypothetical protein
VSGHSRARCIAAAIAGVFLVLTSSCGESTSAQHPAVDPSPQGTPTASTPRAPTFTPSPVFPTAVHTIVPEFEGYYMGTVVIASYYTLLQKQLYEAAYALLSSSEQSRYSLAEYEALQRKADKVAEIITVQPVRARQVEQHLPVTSQDTANEIAFYVKAQLAARGSGPATPPSPGIETEYLTLRKEGDLWKIGASLPGFETPYPTQVAPAPIDPAFVYDLSYYDSLVAISQYYTLFNHGFYEDAYGLRSSFDDHLGSLDEWIALLKLAQIEENSVVEIYPLLESARQFQIRPTPEPMSRRMFYAQIYAEGANGMAGSVANGVHTYFITTLLENGRWKIYSVNTS